MQFEEEKNSKRITPNIERYIDTALLIYIILPKIILKYEQNLGVKTLFDRSKQDISYCFSFKVKYRDSLLITLGLINPGIIVSKIMQ